MLDMISVLLTWMLYSTVSMNEIWTYKYTILVDMLAQGMAKGCLEYSSTVVRKYLFKVSDGVGTLKFKLTPI